MNQAYLESVRLLLAVAPDVLGDPKFALAELPAIRWKQANLARLRDSNRAKFALQSSELRSRLVG